MKKTRAALAIMGLALATTCAHASIITIQESTFSLSFDTAIWGDSVSLHGNQITFNDMDNAALAVGSNHGTADGSFSAPYPQGSLLITAAKGSALSGVTSVESGTYRIGTGATPNSRAGAIFGATETWQDAQSNVVGYSLGSWSSPTSGKSSGTFSVSNSTTFFNGVTGHPAQLSSVSLGYQSFGEAFATGHGSFARINENSDSFTINTIPAPIPEPSTYALFGIGLMGLVAYRRRANRNNLMF